MKTHKGSRGETKKKIEKKENRKTKREKRDHESDTRECFGLCQVSQVINIALVCISYLFALSPGCCPSDLAAPLTPIISSAAPCAGKEVPPPTVPTSIDGMVTDMCKSMRHSKLRKQREKREGDVFI